MTNILVTGANRGLGLEFVRQYGAEGTTIHACCREPRKAKDLQALADAHKGKIVVHALDVTDDGQVGALAHALAEQPIDILINNAGIGGNGGRDPGHIDYAAWSEVFRVNTMAPYRVALAFRDHLRKSAGAKLITISSGMGSTTLHNGSAYVYRSSKAAANNVMHGLAVEWKNDGTIVLILHPGWVRTDMGGPNAPLSPQESISGMRRVIAGAKHSDSGHYLDYQGKELAW